MSTHYRLHCLMCEVDGPDVRHSAGGVGLSAAVPDATPEGAQAEWGEFLMEHEWHGPLLLVHEAQAPERAIEALRMLIPDG